MDLLRLVLRWVLGRWTISEDNAQFYNTCKLDPHQLNLQRFLWLKDLDLESILEEGVITTLMYGVKSVSAQSGYAVEELAEFVKDSDPELYIFLMFCIYVDDLGDSKPTIKSCIDLAKRADELFATVQHH